MIAGEVAAKVGLVSLKEVASDVQLCKRQILMGREGLRQACLPIREGRDGGSSSANIRERPTCDA